MAHKYYVYIMANSKNGTIYVGVTGDIRRRIDEHKTGIFKGFTSKYELKRLVYFEETESIDAAIAREKQLKNWKRDWKLDLIEKVNPNWTDLVENF